MITLPVSFMVQANSVGRAEVEVTSAGTRGDLYLDLGTTSDRFGFPALLPAESKRNGKHECIDEHRIGPGIWWQTTTLGQEGEDSPEGKQERSGEGRKDQRRPPQILG